MILGPDIVSRATGISTRVTALAVLGVIGSEVYAVLERRLRVADVGLGSSCFGSFAASEEHCD